MKSIFKFIANYSHYLGMLIAFAFGFFSAFYDD